MGAVTVTTIVDGKQAHQFPAKEVVGCAIEKIDFSVDTISIPNGDTYTIQLAKVAAGTLVKNVCAVVTTAEGDAITGEIGDGDDVDGWFDGATAEFNLKSATYQKGNGANVTAVGKYYSAADTIDLVIVNASGSTYTLNAMKATLFIEYLQVPGV